MRAGILGGTFNPIHYGHLRAAEEIRLRLGLDRVVFMPAGTPPLKSGDLASSKHRLEMARLATASNPFFCVSDVECARRGVSYTVDTARHLMDKSPGDELFFITGVDTFLDLPSWKDPVGLTGLMNFIIMQRPGFVFSALRGSPFIRVSARTLRDLDSGKTARASGRLAGGREAVLLRIHPLEISSTMIRELLRAGTGAKYLLPETVESFIISHKLYGVRSKGGATLKQ